MNMYQKTRICIAFIAVSVLFCSCKTEDIDFFTGNDSANFWIPSYNHSLFGATTAELDQDTITLNVALSGKLADYDREVTGTVVETHSFTTALPEHYEVLGGLIPANELYGKFKIVVKNPELLATQTDLKVRLSITENTHFKKGLSENSNINITWSRAVLQPATWNAMRIFFSSIYSTQVYKIIIESTGVKELYYFQGAVTPEEARVLGRKFGDRIREINAAQGSPLLHDDGPSKGLPIEPIW